jgi:SpoVK/Ycf46/Vps4 family AAA+-type ATPase
MALDALVARTPSKTLADLADRGATWDVGRGGAGVQLASSFVHPIRHREESTPSIGRPSYDPDRYVVAEDAARSAILYGPPGTSKTALVESVAGALNWPFIEITPAQFLDQGVDRVSARADEIFRTVMELDHCVVLLDEIDQLIQRRDGQAESLDRFFTTTMLPRLARLWELRKVLFFVNTNGIERVDPAIRRSQRFEVPPL